MQQEAVAALEEVMSGDVSKANEHFRLLGVSIGLTRIAKIHAGLIKDLETKRKENVETNT